ncbi:MAG: hypothetical protein Q9M11_01650 [Mariprofundaceae bacterium]|nr:hypothetical protein [Mariprofundaceae bacterium]
MSEISLYVCHQEKIGPRLNSLDSTSFTLSADYLAKTDNETVAINENKMSKLSLLLTQI